MITHPTSANRGPIPSSLSGCSVGKCGNGIGTDSHLQNPAQQRYSWGHHRVAEQRVSQSNNTSDQVRDDWEGLALGIQDGVVSFKLLGLDWTLRHLDRGYRFRMGRGHIMYREAWAQGPWGLWRNPVPYPPLISVWILGMNQGRHAPKAPREAHGSVTKQIRRLFMCSWKVCHARLSGVIIIIAWRFVNRGSACGS